MTITDVTRVALGVVGGPAVRPTGAPASADGPSFDAVLKSSLAQVSTLQQAADQAITQLSAGGATSLHETLLALEHADRSFRLMMEVRNKIVEAYEQVLRMQV